MKHLGIEVPVKNVPELDPGFLPLGKFCTAFLKDAKKPLDIAVERAGGEVAVYKTFIHGTPDMAEADIYYVDRIIKMLLSDFLQIRGKIHIHMLITESNGRTQRK